MHMNINTVEKNLHEFPADMLVEVTNKCNHSCVFCVHHHIKSYGLKKKQGEIDPVLLRRILLEGYDMGLRRVGLYSMGEMFMCSCIASHIRSAKEVGYEYIYADTNGVLASEARLTEVITAGLDSIKFSINAGSRETYVNIHGHDDFDKVIANLKTCHNLKSVLNPELNIKVSFVVTKQTENEVELLREKVSPYIDAFMPHGVRPYLQQYDDDLSFMGSSVYGEINYTLPCHIAMKSINVTFDGHLSACCADFNHDLLLADLRETTLEDAWFSHSAREFRKRHMLQQVEGTMCHGCSAGKYKDYKPLEFS